MKMLAAVLFLSVCANAQTYSETILYNFGSSSGGASGPTDGLVMDKSNNLYGAANGVVFKLSPSGTYTILSQSGGSNTLVIDKSGTLYGTSQSGGLGYGFVYKITSAKKYSVLHQFGRVSGDGLYPYGPLTLDTAGNIYGSTQFGGDAACNCGTIFKVSAKGVETVLYKFLGGNDGSYPQANVLRDGKGNLCGTTRNSGGGDGVVWELTSKNIESILYNQDSGGNMAELDYIVRDAAGNFYTEQNANIGCCPNNGGIVKISGGVSTYYEFYFSDGSCPSTIMLGALSFFEGNLYGVEPFGGAYETCVIGGQSLSGGGDVYNFNPTTGGGSTLYSFPDPSSGSTDGWGPTGGVIADAAGNLYGTTAGGGASGLGTVFKLTKN